MTVLPAVPSMPSAMAAWAARLAVGERPELAAMRAVLVSRSRCWGLPGRRRCERRAIAPAHVRAAWQEKNAVLARPDVRVTVEGQHLCELRFELLSEVVMALGLMKVPQSSQR